MIWKIIFILIILLLIGGFFVISSNNLHLKDAKSVDTFIGLYDSWIKNVTIKTEEFTGNFVNIKNP